MRHVKWAGAVLAAVFFASSAHAQVKWAVTPFGARGIGSTVTHPSVDSDFQLPTGAQAESNSLFNFNFGLGVRVAMNEQLATRLEARWRVTDTNLQTSSGLWCDPYGYCYSYSSQWYDAGEVEAGISYSFK